ncbi:hypothetical protein QWI17_20550 [Gilvimarinus sp. SDUM040013]|uniref:Uncharacterized protein n=1 Tax=Gilvimarinus gilvus TaxID=3058038 RepID=A0ABU4RSD1_9GAMM|nr:hypothetical protein [Gilvimarinus sp. SDUM040013]MDO3388249.1 hypothetical protein [Gilvimarinus sp. SDUM040013]MDX6847799.1 hypothetical protein [Gilvimarinus sp. SDUM040013]
MMLFIGVLGYMKVLVFLLVCAISHSVSAWECGKYDRDKFSLETHYEYATEIFFGKVLEGRVNKSKKYESDMEFIVEPTLVLKGNLKTPVKLTTYSTPPYDPVALGYSYLIFLYGSNKVDYCGVFIETTDVDSREEFVDLSKRKDVYYAEYIRQILAIYESKNK